MVGRWLSLCHRPGNSPAEPGSAHRKDGSMPGNEATPGEEPPGRGDPGPPGRRPRSLRPLIFSGALGLLLVRFLLPVPVGQADNRDGPRLMCGKGLGLGPVMPAHFPRFFRYAYFQYAPSPECRSLGRPYPTSEIVPLELARALTRLLGLPGAINLIALGLIFCVAAATGITALATGL